MSLPEWKHPVVGAFILPGIVARLRNRKLNFRSYWRVLELANTAQELGITLYYFSNRHVDFQQKQVRGVWLDEKTETWKTGTFPLPDVLYDRQGAEGAGSPEKMRELGIPCINPTWVLNKWKTYKALSGSPEIRPHLPPTYSYSRSRLVSALERCGTVYVKACVGSRGAQVLRITRIGKQHYECRYWKEKLVATRIQGTRNLAVFTKHFFKGRKILIQPPFPC